MYLLSQYSTIHTYLMHIWVYLSKFIEILQKVRLVRIVVAYFYEGMIMMPSSMAWCTIGPFMVFCWRHDLDLSDTFGLHNLPSSRRSFCWEEHVGLPYWIPMGSFYLVKRGENKICCKKKSVQSLNCHWFFVYWPEFEITIPLPR